MSVRLTNVANSDNPLRARTLVGPGWVYVVACAVSAVLLGAGFMQDLLLYSGAKPDLSNKIWLLDVDSEDSAFTWLSVVVAFSAAWLLFLASRDAAMRGGRFKYHWYALTGLFLLLSFDEFAGIHEKISAALSGRMEHTGLMYFAWAAPAGIVSLIGLAAFIPFIRSFPLTLAGLLVLSALIFLGGAVGFEMIGGSVAEVEGIESFRYRILTNIEEGLEMAGILVFIYVLLCHLKLSGATLQPSA
jgi:hypothetical protein